MHVDGAVVLRQSALGGGTVVGPEPLIAYGLAVDGPSTTREQDLIDLRRVSRQSTSALTTLGSLERKRSTRAGKRERLEFTMTKRFSIVLNLMMWSPLNRRQARLM